jgi:hypothetical protein
VTEQRAHLLQIVMLLEHLHRHAVPQVVRLELGHADQPTVRLAEPPDVLALSGHHRRTPCRPGLAQSAIDHSPGGGTWLSLWQGREVVIVKLSMPSLEALLLTLAKELGANAGEASTAGAAEC